MVKRNCEPRKACLAVAMVVMALGGAGCGGGGSASSSTRTAASVTSPVASSSRSTEPADASHTEGTRIAYVRPTTKSGSLRPGYTVSAHLSGGVCREHAEVVRGEAYECSVGYEGHGPCWPIGKGAATAEVLCVELPWEHRCVEIRLQKGPHPPPRSPAERPVIWGLELESGQRCYDTRGAVSAVGGVPIRFACGATGLQLLGTPDEAEPLWTIREVVVQRKEHARPTLSAGRLERVAVAWYGVGAAT